VFLNLFTYLQYANVTTDAARRHGPRYACVARQKVFELEMAYGRTYYGLVEVLARGVLLLLLLLTRRWRGDPAQDKAAVAVAAAGSKHVATWVVRAEPASWL